MDIAPIFFASQCKACEVAMIGRSKFYLNHCPQCGSLDWTTHREVQLADLDTELKRKQIDADVKYHQTY